MGTPVAIKFDVKIAGIKVRLEAARMRWRNFAMRNLAGKIAVGPLVVAAIVAFCSTRADAQEKIWKHGLINAKSDAGIFLMVSTR